MNLLRTLKTTALAALAVNTSAQQLIPTKGKDFWFGFMENYGGGGNQHLYVYISSDANTQGTMSSPLIGWSQPFTVTANTVTQLEVPLTTMHHGSEILENKSVHIVTQDTVAVYALNLESATADAAVIYPTKSLGTDYRVQAFYGLAGFGTLNSEMLIVATADGTTIEIIPSTGTLGGQPANVPFTVQLDQGETYQVQASTGDGDFTGSVIRGTQESGGCRPFAVFSGSVCPDVPTGCFACDHVFDQNLPTPFWGTKYFSVPWQDADVYLYRVLANEDNTIVTIDGATIPTLNAGQYYEIQNTPDAHCFSGNKPFSVAQFMQGNDCSGNSDPALLILNAEEQRIDDITFAAVVSPNITAQYINVIVDANNTSQVTLDGNLVPAVQFSTFSACADHAHATLPLTQGSHRISCPSGLTGYVYGTGPNYETYAYSVGSFTSIPALNYDTVFCGLDTSDVVTLSPPEPVFNPWWSVQSAPNDTLFEGISFTFQPSASDIYVLTGTENISGCTQQYFFSVELGEPPATEILTPPLVCAYSPTTIDLQLQPVGTYLYEWTPSAGLNDPHVQDPVVTAAHDTWYHVNVTTLTGCAQTEDSVLVQVSPGDVLDVVTTATPALICEGQDAHLGVQVAQIIAEDDMDGGIGALWEQVQNCTSSNICGSVFGNALYFDGNGNRFARTVPLNVSNGGSLRYALKLATGVAPCADVTDDIEGVLVEYSLDGNSWVLMAQYGQSAFPDFGSVVMPIPVAAQSPNTRFRWRQLLNSGAGFDNWMLDDVAIASNNNTGISFNWTPAATLSGANVPDPIATPPTTQTYTVNLTDQVTGCQYHDEVSISVGPMFTVDMLNDTALCGFGAVQLNATPDQPGVYSYVWSPDNFTLSSTVVADPFAGPFETTDYIVQITSAFGCVVTDTVTVTVAQQLLADVFAAPNPVCPGDQANLQVQAYQGSGFYAYQWTPASSLDDATSATPIATPSSTTNYIVSVTDQLCGVVVQEGITLQVIPGPVVDLGDDLGLCPGQTIVLDAGAGGASYTWSTQESSQTIDVDEEGTYWVTVSNGQCVSTDTVEVDAAVDPGDLEFIVFGCEGGQAVLTIPYEAVSYAWAGGEVSRAITVGAFGDFPFTIQDAYGCTFSGVAHYRTDPLSDGLEVPNVVSPNGDNKNDYFTPLSGGNKQVAVTIYNRYGQEVFSASDMGQLWNGRTKGGEVAEGTYFYVVRFTPVCDPRPQELKGAVTVVR